MPPDWPGHAVQYSLIGQDMAYGRKYIGRDQIYIYIYIEPERQLKAVFFGLAFCFTRAARCCVGKFLGLM
jgi:hypothetical protein